MATDRRDGAAGHVRDLGVRQPLEVVQDHHCPLGERQRGQGVGDRVDGEVALGLRGGLRAGIGHIREEIQGVGTVARGSPY